MMKGIVVAFALLSQQSLADEVVIPDDNLRQIEPFLVNGELPIARGAGLPKALPAMLVGGWEFGLYSELQSNASDSGASVESAEGGESLVLDGETGIIGISLAAPFAERWELRLQTEYVRHAPGRLDGLIEQWHDTFGLSQGDRTIFDEDQLLFSYQASSQQSLEQLNTLSQRSKGFADTALSIAYQLNEKHLSATSLRVGLNLPTGDTKKVLGSDKVDGSISLHQAGKDLAGVSGLGWHGNVGYLRIGDERLFGIKTEQDVFFSSIGLHWLASEQWTLKAQLDSHSELFESEIDELSRSASQLTLGVAYLAGSHGKKERSVIEGYFAEDVTVNRAPDFTFGLRSRWRF